MKGFLSTRIMVRSHPSLSPSGAVQRSLHAELVGEVPVMVAPELLLQGDGDSFAHRQCIKKGFRRNAVIAFDEQGASLYRF